MYRAAKFSFDHVVIILLLQFQLCSKYLSIQIQPCMVSGDTEFRVSHNSCVEQFII